MSSEVVKNNYQAILEKNYSDFKPLSVCGKVPNGFFKNHLGKGKNQYLALLGKIRSILIESALTTKQKIDYCCIERYLMKKYLKKVIIKIM